MELLLMSTNERRGVGRPRKTNIIETPNNPIPRLGQYIKIEEIRAKGNTKKRNWVGVVIDDNSNYIIVLLNNQCKECFLKLDFKYRILKYIVLD